MTTPFATPDDLAPRLPDFDPEDAADVSSVEALLQQATDYLVAELGDPGLATGSGVERTIFGSGTAYLYVGPHEGTVTADDVEASGGYGVPDFYDSGDYLVATDGSGNVLPSSVWPHGAAYVVTADFGPATVAGDLKLACIDLAAFWYVESYVENPVAPSGDIPERVRKTVDRLRYQRAFAGGGL